VERKGPEWENLKGEWAQEAFPDWDEKVRPKVGKPKSPVEKGQKKNPGRGSYSDQGGEGHAKPGIQTYAVRMPELVKKGGAKENHGKD